MRKSSWYLVGLVLALMPNLGLSACPFCSAVSQTLRQEMAAMDTVAIAKIMAGTESDSDAEFSIVSVIRGQKLVQEEQALRVNYFGNAKPKQQFLLMGVDPPDLLWSSPLPVSETAIKYVEAINQLPDDVMARLEFYMEYLEHPESLLARDAYDEFASAPYGEIKKLKSKLDREQLIEWIKDPGLPPDRKRLYLVMLGVCGKASDTALLEELLKSEDPNRRAGLDSMIACYVTLKGADGLDLIDELFLSNTKSQYADTYAAIMALRFHGTEGGVVEKDRVLKSMQLILDRPELADLVIPDLARWEDWSQIDKLVELFKNADEKSSWVRVPVINYLRACPKPEATTRLDEIKEIDPAAYKRATSFFPVPKTSKESSSTLSPNSTRNIAADFGASANPQALASTRSVAARSHEAGSLRRSAAAIDASDRISLANRIVAGSVIMMSTTTLGLAMWLSISGTGYRSIPVEAKS